MVLFGPEEVAFEAADRILRLEQGVIKERNEFRLVLSGGSVPRRFSDVLAGASVRPRLSWTRVRFFWGDEGCVRVQHPKSNDRSARQARLEKLISLMPASTQNRETDFSSVAQNAFGFLFRSPVRQPRDRTPHPS